MRERHFLLLTSRITSNADGTCSALVQVTQFSMGFRDRFWAACKTGIQLAVNATSQPSIVLAALALIV